MEVSQRGVRQRVAGRVVVGRASVENGAAIVSRAPVLVLAIANDHDSGSDRVLAADVGEVVRYGDVRRGREQVHSRRTIVGGEAVYVDIGNSGGIGAVAAEHQRKLKPERAPLPILALQGRALAIPRRVDLGFIEDARADGPGVAHLRAVPRPVAGRGSGGKLRAVKCAERVDQVVVIVDPASIDSVAAAGLVIDLHDILPPIERLQHLEGRIVGRGRIRIVRGELAHFAENLQDRFAVRSHQAGEILVRNGCSGPGVTDVRGGPVRKISADFGQRWQRSARGTCETPDSFPFLTGEKKHFPLLDRTKDDRTAQIPPEVREAQDRLYGREVVLGVEVVVAQRFYQPAVETRRAALGDHVDRRAGIASILGREIGGLRPHLADEIHADVVDLASVAAGVEVHAAVDHEVAGAGPAAVRRPGRDAQAGGGRHLVFVQQRHARYQRNQLQIVAAVQRQVLHLFGVDGVTDFAGDVVYGLAEHLADNHGFVDRAHFELEVGREASGVR